MRMHSHLVGMGDNNDPTKNVQLVQMTKQGAPIDATSVVS